MANLLWQRQQQAQKQLDDQTKADAYQMLAVSKMDPQTMLGYKLGQYIGNYLDRGQERAANKALDPSATFDSIAAKNGGVSTNLMDGLTPETGAQASNLLAGLGTQGAAPVAAAASAAAAPSAWEKLAAQNGDVSNGGLLGGISGGTPGDAAKAAGGAGTDILGSIGGVGSAARLANGNGNIGDIANLAKLFGFFDPAATPTATVKADAAPQPQQVVQEAQPQEGQQQENVQSAAQQANQTQQPDSSGLLVKSIANGELLPTPNLVANHNQNVLQAVKQAVNPDVSSEEYYNQVYNTLRDKGYGYDVCNRVAAQKAQAYQAQRISDLSSQFTSSGLNPNGAVNNSGAQILVKLAQESPQSYEILSRMYATPKDDYGFNKSVQQAVLNSGLQWQRDDHLLTNEEKKAKANLERTKDLHNFDANLNVQQKEALAQVELKTKGMELRQRYGIMFDAAKRLGLDDKSASQYALGIIDKDNSRYMDPQVKAKLAASSNIIEDYKNFMSKNLDGKQTYPHMDAYNEAIAFQRSVLNGGGQSGGGGQERNLNNYNEAVADATDLLSRATQKGGYTKQQLIDGFKKRYGDMADNIIAGIDWSQWGYPNEETKQTKQAAGGDPNYTGEEYLLGSK